MADSEAKGDLATIPEIKYCVAISGNYKQLYDEIRTSDLLTDKTKMVSNMYILKSRVSRFISTVERVFCMHGYFDVDVKKNIKGNDNNCTCIGINIDSGQVYKISAVNIKFEDPQNLYAVDGLPEKLRNKKFMLQTVKQPATYQFVEELAQIVQDYFLKRGYPFVVVSSKVIDVNRETHQAKVQFLVKLGEKVLFGPTTIEGVKSVDEEYIRNRIYWTPNSIYNIRLVENTIYALSNSQIFSKAEVYVDAEHIKDHVAPMIIELSEDKKRAIEVSLFYSTVKSYNFQKLSTRKKNLRSFYASIGLSHYNLFHKGETLKFKIFGSPFSLNDSHNSHDYEISLDFIKPDFLAPRDKMTFSAALSRNNQNAYYMLGKNVGSFWTSPFIFPDLKVRIGTFLENNDVNGPHDICQKYKSCSFPISMTFDKRDSILNPTKGYKTSLSFTPIFMSGGKNISRINIYATQVIRLFHNQNSILAYWISGSKIFQREVKAIPLDKRIYAGGISSIRGYGNQMAGPLYKTSGDFGTNYPIGGTSSVELGGELRQHIYKEISGAVFVESAAVGSFKKWYTGYGVGIRYQTVLGPVRLDVAFPLKRRHNIDNRFHFYLSFGQAF